MKLNDKKINYIIREKNKRRSSTDNSFAKPG